jgi:predicted RNA-binding Zn-ribbon protein involved in translation (DUF1610 family)
MFHNNEDAGDLSQMNAADASACRPIDCPECGTYLGTAEDFEDCECPNCGEAVTEEDIS